MTIATQTLSQLPENSLAAIFGNCATLVSFRVSAHDAKELIPELAVSGEGPRTLKQAFDPIVPVTELQNLPDYKLYVRTLYGNHPQEPFLVDSFPSLLADARSAKAFDVARTSVERYGCRRELVERGLRRFLTA